MTAPNNQDPLKDFEEFNEEIKKFNKEIFRISQLPTEETKKAAIKVLAQKVLDKSKELPLGTISEVGGDAVTITSCALAPEHVIPCLGAIVAVIDIIKEAKQKKLQ